MLRTAIGLAACLLLAVPLRADDEGFRPLFNGKDLSGWITPDDKTLFAVENGEIVGRTRAEPEAKKSSLKKNEFLVTDRDYGDFVLKAKIKLINHNSGIQFRSKRAPSGVVSGPQADAAVGYWGLFYEEKGRGILEPISKEKSAALARNGEWNEYVIAAKGDHVTIDLNGTRVVDRTDPKFDKAGVIALQLHAGPPMEVRFKDIAIKPLD
jgi:hypothetical protein